MGDSRLLFSLHLVALVTVSSLQNCRPAIDQGARVKEAVHSQKTTISTPNQTIFFHWGEAEKNRNLIKFGWWGENQLKQMKRDELENTIDVAGTGVYIAGDLSSSASYGNDLLVVKIVDRDGHGIEIPTASAAELKESSVAGVLNGRGNQDLRVVSRFMSDPDWLVLSRLPQSSENIRVEITKFEIRLVNEYIGYLATLDPAEIIGTIFKTYHLWRSKGDMVKSFVDPIVFKFGLDYVSKFTADEIRSIDMPAHFKVLAGLYSEHKAEDARTIEFLKTHLAVSHSPASPCLRISGDR